MDGVGSSTSRRARLLGGGSIVMAGAHRRAKDKTNCTLTRFSQMLELRPASVPH